MFESIEEIFREIVKYGVLALEIVGAVLVLFFSILALIELFKRDKQKSREQMVKGITLGLNFLLGSEVLRTIIAPDWNDIGMTCAVLAMRAGITVLLHWEKKHGEE